MMILAQGIVNKLSDGVVSPVLVRIYAGGGGKSSSIAGFGLCDILCYSECSEESQDYAGSGLIQNIYPYSGGAAA